MSMANLYLRALSSLGPNRPKPSAAVMDWDLEGVLTALFTEAHAELARRAPHPRQSRRRMARAAGSLFGNYVFSGVPRLHLKLKLFTSSQFTLYVPAACGRNRVIC